MKNKIVFIVFLCMGMIFAAAATREYFKTAAFIKVAKHAEATVTSVTSRQATCKSSGKDGRSYSCTKYDSRGKFVTNAGQQVEVELFHGESSPSYQQGQSVKVLYDPANPNDAKAESTSRVWGSSIALTFVSTVMLLLGGGGLFFVLKREKEIAWLKQHGERVKARFLSVEEQTHRTGSKHGRRRKYYSYRICCQWLDPRSGAMHVFKSDTLKYNPGDRLRGGELEVFVDPDNPKRYYVDLSNLPGVA